MSIAVLLAGFGCVFLIAIFVLINKYSRRNKFGMKGKRKHIVWQLSAVKMIASFRKYKKIHFLRVPEVKATLCYLNF